MTGFWMLALLWVLLIPGLMVGFGCAFAGKAPAKINPFFGYRTALSMKNRDTWDFAHRYFGRLWYRLGLVLLPLSLIPMILVANKPEQTVALVAVCLCCAQTIPMLIPIGLTQRALRRKFDAHGHPKTGQEP